MLSLTRSGGSLNVEVHYQPLHPARSAGRGQRVHASMRRS
jgi:hypothetical protein